MHYSRNKDRLTLNFKYLNYNDDANGIVLWKGPYYFSLTVVYLLYLQRINEGC